MLAPFTWVTSWEAVGGGGILPHTPLCSRVLQQQPMRRPWLSALDHMTVEETVATWPPGVQRWH